MIDGAGFRIPDMGEMLDAFGVIPVDVSTQEGYYLYEFRDNLGMVLRLSFHQQERSVQTVLFVNGSEVLIVSQEGAVELKIADADGKSVLWGVFTADNMRSKLEIRFHPHVSVKWATLVER